MIVTILANAWDISVNYPLGFLLAFMIVAIFIIGLLTNASRKKIVRVIHQETFFNHSLRKDEVVQNDMLGVSRLIRLTIRLLKGRTAILDKAFLNWSLFLLLGAISFYFIISNPPQRIEANSDPAPSHNMASKNAVEAHQPVSLR